MDAENKTVEQQECENQENNRYSIEKVVSRFPESQHALLRQSLTETETVLRNYLFSLIM